MRGQHAPERDRHTQIRLARAYDIVECVQGVSEHPEHPAQEDSQDDFYIHALLLLFFASQNRPMVATK